MAHTKKQIELIDYCQRFEVCESDFARWCNVKPNVISYQLNSANEIADKYYNKIIKRLIEKGHLSNTNECDQLFDLTTEIFSSLVTQFNLYKNEVMRTIKNKKIERDERPRLRTKIDDFRSDMNKKCDELIKTFGL